MAAKKRIDVKARKERPAPVVVKKAAPASSPAVATDAPDKRPRAPAKGRQEGAGAGAPDAPRFMGGPRNEHGTRVARRVACSRCGKSDHVPYVPKDVTKALCRDCAAEVLKTFEHGVKVRMPTRDAVCNLCGTPFKLPITAEDDGDPLCQNCLRGFTTWQGSVDTPFAERQDTVVEERLSGALVRKRVAKPGA